MPQMMPLNWLTLFLYFIAIFMLFNIILFFNFNINKDTSFKKFYKNKLNWKW
uniref:ATP synthase complex subunit 8 n=1 Tax=Nephus includens TaxID=703267 RepID=A0A6M3WE01_9CUCU|nr:ATP synthase F0 subunit 8 [Nephus includens]